MDDSNNPWAQDAMTEPWNALRDETTAASAGAATSEREHDAVKTCTATLHITLDGLVGVLLCVYAFLLEEHDISKPIFAVLLWLGTVRIVRCAMMLTALYAHVYAFGFITASAWTGACMSVVYFIPSMAALGIRRKLTTYVTNHASQWYIGTRALHFYEHHSNVIWIVTLVVAAMELVSSIWLFYYRWSYLNSDDDDNAGGPRRHRPRPWWWQPANNAEPSLLEDPLLPHPWASMARDTEYEANHGIAANTRPWSRWFAKQPSSNHARDEGSVDFSDVQEDWASRSEEDPFWWTKAGGESSS
jgi:hypothetical protein